MGGIGSGRRSYATTATVDQSETIDANELNELLRDPGEIGKLRWTGNDSTISFAVHSAGDTGRSPALRVAYELDSVEVREDIQIEWQPVNFGGHRPWFRCPGCDDRKGTLHRPPAGRRFRCRDCHGLGYRSERSDAQTRAKLRFQRIHEQIDGRRPHPNNASLPPEKPKGMHQETHDALVHDLLDAFEDWDRISRSQLADLAGDIGLV
jgi:hypothetical protein